MAAMALGPLLSARGDNTLRVVVAFRFFSGRTIEHAAADGGSNRLSIGAKPAPYVAQQKGLVSLGSTRFFL
jgi:hypothetical protein